VQEYQRRVIDEHFELEKKIHKLTEFIAGPVFCGLSSAEQRLLRRQQVLMELYAETITARIDGFNLEGD